MPRYFFNVREGDCTNIVRDFEGSELPGLQEAKKEALDFARDIVRHGFREPKEKWKLVVADENAVELMSIPLAQIRAGKRQLMSDLCRRLDSFDRSFRPRALSLMIAAALIVMIAQSTLRRDMADKESSGYRTAAVPVAGTILSVRFAPQTRVAEMTEFLDYYNASLVGGPRPAGFYSVQISAERLPKEALAQVLSRMTAEKVVELASTVR